MMMKSISIMLLMGGVMLWFTTKIDAFMSLLGMDYVGVFMMIAAVIVLIFRMGMTGVSKQFEYISPMQSLIYYIRRDANVVPLLGTRVYSGESFLDVPKLGLIEDLGKDTVFSFGGKKIRFGLENINFTPDPRYFNLTSELYRLGFDDSDELNMIMNIPGIGDKNTRAYYLERMGRIYWNMVHPPLHGAKRFVENMKTKKPRGRIVFFAKGKPQTKKPVPVEKKQKTINEEVDKFLKEKIV